MSSGDAARPEPAVMKWWWLAPPGAIWWSPEERRVRLALGCITTFFFLLIWLPEWWLMAKLGLDPQFAVVGLALAVTVGLLAARPIGERLWPEVLRKGDAKAAQRLIARQRRP